MPRLARVPSCLVALAATILVVLAFPVRPAVARLCITDTYTDVAVVISNADYADFIPAAANASADARLVAEALARRGFKVHLGIDLDREAMEGILSRALIACSVKRLLVYFAGAAFGHEGRAYAIPARPDLRKADLGTPEVVAARSLAFDDLLVRAAGNDGSGHVEEVVAVFDACTAPLSVVLAGEDKGLVPVADASKHAPLAGMFALLPRLRLVAFSAEVGKSVMDAAPGDPGHGPFALALAEALASGEKDLDRLLVAVRDATQSHSGGSQVAVWYRAPELGSMRVGQPGVVVPFEKTTLH